MMDIETMRDRLDDNCEVLIALGDVSASYDPQLLADISQMVEHVVTESGVFPKRMHSKAIAFGDVVTKTALYFYLIHWRRMQAHKQYRRVINAINGTPASCTPTGEPKDQP